MTVWNPREVIRRFPSLRTERLSMVVPTRTDAVAILAIASDPRTTEHNRSDRLSSLSEAEALVTGWIEHWQRFGFGYWCVRFDDHPEVIGYCGTKVTAFRGGQALNLIYRFATTVWGTGIATEAARAAVAWAEHQPDRRVIARIRPANVSSQRVAVKAGLRRNAALDEEGEDGLDWVFTL